MVTIKLGHKDLQIIEEIVSLVNRMHLIDLFIRQEITVLFWGLLNTSYVWRKNLGLPAEYRQVEAEPLLYCLPVELPLSVWIRE